MRAYIFKIYFFLLLASGIAVTGQRHAGTFNDPPSSERTRFRYWLPDASVDPEVVKADVKSVGSVGGGGLEFLAFFEYGGHVGSMPSGADWTKYNFGTPPFQNLFRAALEAHHENDLVMDFPIGPNQGQGVPADITEDGLQLDLVPFTARVPRNGVFNGKIPGWGAGELIAFTSALVLQQDSHSFQAQDNFDVKNVTYGEYTLREASLDDHTRQVDMKSGKAALKLRGASKGTHYRVFAFYQRKSLNKNLDFTPTAKMEDNMFRNGSYAVDHFSAAGGQAIARFWEKHILTNGVKDLLITAGNYAWEDSVEVVSNITWSQSFPKRYQSRFGHSMNRYLPLFAFKQNNLSLQPADPGKFHCMLESEVQTNRYLNNFHLIVADGYAEYLLSLRSWAKTLLGKELSVQPAYNLPMDMSGAIPLVDAPECESFGFKDDIDLYRRFVGPAQLSGKRVISNELGAIPMTAYQYTIPRMLFSMNRGFAAGVNQYVLHGGAYTGNYYGTTWPGHTGFAYLFSEAWSEKQPSWDNGFKDALDYAARVSHALRQGVPKIDVVKYSKESITNITTSPAPADLVKDGWSYTYISPDNFGLKGLEVRDRQLAPTGPAWKAMFIDASESLTIDAVKRLRTFAKAGFPIILSGGSPSFYPVGKDKEEDFQHQLSALKASANVYQVGAGKVSQQLTHLGLTPRVQVRTKGTWYTTWYEAGDIDYAFAYNDVHDSTGELILSACSIPYFYDAWTGQRAPVLVYHQEHGKTTIPLSLSENQTVIIACGKKLSKEIPTPRRHVVFAPPSVIGTASTSSFSLSLHVGHSNDIQTACLDNGKKITIDGTAVPQQFQLQNWNLTAERWETPKNFSDASIIASKRNTTHILSKLESWDRLPALVNASGVGHYSTTFDWPLSSKSGRHEADGAYLDIGRVTHAARVMVNGKMAPPLDTFKPRVDISSYVVAGKNTVTVVVPTTMWNYLRGLLPKIRTAGSVPFPVQAGIPLLPMEVGLVGPVTLTPFKALQVST